MLTCEDDSVSDSIHCIIVRLEITEQGWATIVSFWVPASVFYSTDELLSSVLVVCVQCLKLSWNPRMEALKRIVFFISGRVLVFHVLFFGWGVQHGLAIRNDFRAGNCVSAPHVV